MPNQFKIFHVSRLEGHPVLKFAVSAWNDLLQKDLIGNNIILLPAHSAIYVMEGDTISAVLVYSTAWSTMTVWLAYVAENKRGFGIYRAMYQAIERFATASDIHEIVTTVTFKNKDLSRVMTEIGQRPIRITYTIEPTNCTTPTFEEGGP